MVDGQADHLHRPVLSCIRTNIARLCPESTVRESLDSIRDKDIGDEIVYFYVVDGADRLLGVVPTRRLLTSPLDLRISDVMISSVVTIPQRATVLEAYEFFILHKFLAFPVVDEERRVLGLVDIGMFTDDIFDAADQSSMDRMFETIGFRLLQVREASPFRAFRFRFPWLITTIISGTFCALLAGVFEVTLAKSIVLAFFLTLVLGLGESVSMQSMTMTIQSLRSTQPTAAWYLRALRREAGTALLLGGASGFVVALIAWLWRGELLVAATIGGSLLLTISAAGLFGMSIPALLHRTRLDLKIAAGPLTLALTDLSTLLIYLVLATLFL